MELISSIKSTARVRRGRCTCALLVTLLACVVAVPVQAGGDEKEGIIRTNENDPSSEAVVSSSVPDIIVRLNSRIFTGNVLEGQERTQHWVVLFCPSWWDPCQKLERHFPAHAARWEDKLNQESLVNLPVRFASVDCATDKVLCNQQKVHSYPTVVHYESGKYGAVWTGNGRNDQKRLEKWLEEQLSGVRPPQTVPTPALSVRASLERTIVNIPVPSYCLDAGIIFASLLSVMLMVTRNPSLCKTLQEETQLCSQKEDSCAAPARSEDKGVVPDTIHDNVTAAVVSMLPGEWWANSESIHL